MFIQIEKTGDPAVLRFLPGRSVLDAGEMTFDSAERAARSPLAARLFEIDAVRRVTLGAEHIAVEIDADWQLFKPVVLGIVMEHFIANRPLLLDDGDGTTVDHDPADAAVVADIAELLDARVRPAMRAGGTDAILRAYRGGMVEIELVGAPPTGPLFSLQVRIENTLRHYVPEVQGVRIAGAGESAAAAALRANLDLDDPETAAVYDLLEEQINPSVAAHGGHISLVEVKEHTAYIRLEGGCQGCGMADVTLKQGVEVAIKEQVPSIVAVLDATDHAGGENPYFEPDKGGLSPY